MNSAAPSTTATAGGSMPSDPDCVWFYLSADGQQCGPVTPADIADLLIDRDINSKTLGSVEINRGQSFPTRFF